MSQIFTSEFIKLRPTTEEDLDYVMAAERADENSSFVGQWSREQHEATFTSPKFLHFIIEPADDSRTIGFAIMTDMDSRDESIGLQRIVISEKGKGYGRAVIRLIIKLAFEEWQAHRLWLDVVDFNERARHVYQAEGFVQEGIMRECLKYEGRYASTVFMAILRSEYEALISGREDTGA